MTAELLAEPPISVPVLSVRDLHTRVDGRSGGTDILRGVSFDVRAGQTLAVVGESGSGKSFTALTIAGLLPRGARVTAGQVLLDGVDVLHLTEARRRGLRGASIGMVYQDPMTALNPVMRIGHQVAEGLRAHSWSTSAARERTLEVLNEVGLPSPRTLARLYPHQLSGGMRQRVLIACALAPRPKVLIADEPTTALDVTIQQQILEVVTRLRDTYGLAVIWITHDLGVVARIADSVAVMYAGRVVERAETGPLFAQPAHPYTDGLLQSIPTPSHAHQAALPQIGGTPVSLAALPQGCPFAPRCPDRIDQCAAVEPPLLDRGLSLAACWVPPRTGAPGRKWAPMADSPMVQMVDVVKHYPTAGRGLVRALDGINLTVAKGSVLGVVGESGCGKSTAARLLALLETPTSGSVHVAGTDIATLDGAGRRAFRRTVQMVFQDPYGSLDPRQHIGDALGEVLRVHGLASGRTAVRSAVAELLDTVGLVRSTADRYPHQLSGGQRQRVGIARALSVKPDLVILDEPVSALDVSVRAEIINLLDRLRTEFGLTYVFISHDLGMVRHLADRIAVMYLGQIVEYGDWQQLSDRPLHPYTEALQAAVPVADPAREAARQVTAVRGEIPDAARPPAGCRFHPRCPLVEDICRTAVPGLLPPHGDHRLACHVRQRGRASVETSARGQGAA